MNTYRLKSTGQVVTEQEYRALKPNVSYPAVLVPDDADAILQAPIPSYNADTHSVSQGQPVQDALGNYVTGYIITPLSEESIAASLLAAKTAKNLAINQWRAAANASTFTHDGHTYSCDALSRGDIDAVAGSISLTGAFPQYFPMAWKDVANNIVAMPTVDAFKAFYSSMTMQGTVNFGKSQTLKAALEAATSPSEVNAIVWP